MIAMRRLDTSQPDFAARLEELLAFESAQDPGIDATVAAILDDVKARGDVALLDYTRRFDRVDVKSAAELEIPQATLERALAGLPAAQRAALTAAEQRVRSYHEKQLTRSWHYSEPDGTELGQQITPLERVGIYVPGGKAAYPSSVIMNAVPARVAGVREIIMTVPTPDGQRNDLVLAAAALCGIDRIFTIGGAQAIAALAYGRRPFHPWTRSSDRATPTWPRPSAACSA
jgi:histidinol dehydrogenase